jgi:hypothetical protein
MSASGTHNPPEFKHAEDMEWEMGRFGNVTKFLFHPRPERPTEPNAGFLKYAPGASFPLHFRLSATFRKTSLATAAAAPNPHRRSNAHRSPAGSFFGSFRTPVPLYRVERSRRAGIRNP